MVRQKKKRQRKSTTAGATPGSDGIPTAAAVADAVASPAATVTAAQALTLSRKWLVGVVLVVAAWIAALAGLALLTADETMLNRAQIRQADFIASGRIVDAAQGTFAVDTIWKSAAAEQPPSGDAPITVRDLSESRARQGAAYLVPLTRVRGDAFEITRPRLQDERASRAERLRPPRIYPANPHSLDQLRRMLDDGVNLRAASGVR